MAANPVIDNLQSSTIYPLNTSRGITNIGSHPDNDIVIDDYGVAPFHLMIDHRQKPFRVIILNPQAEVCINGVRLAGAEPKEVTDLSQVSFAGYAIRQQEPSNGSLPERISILPLSAVPAFSGLANNPPGVGVLGGFGSPAAASPGITQAGAVAGSGKLNQDLTRSEDVIMLDLKEPALETAVEQTAVYHLSVLNGGPIVAAFSVAVEGVPNEWVSISPDKLNLYEGTRTTPEIRISPPRDPSSLAKDYSLRVVVTSPNYPGIYGEATGKLTVLPYQDYAVGNLSPRNQSLAWSKKAGRVSLPITNLGNSPVEYQVSAQDEENGCLFGFPLEQQTGLVKQAQVRVDPGQTFAVPLTITPLKRSLVRLRNKSYAYTVSTMPLENPTALRSVAGSLISRALFGPLSILLAVIIVMVLAYLLLIPKISSFSVKNKIIRMGEPALLTWKVSAFTTNLQIPEIVDPLKPSLSSVSITPTQTITTYTLIASNWLSNLLRMDIRWPQPVTVLAIPSHPEIATFTIDRTEIFEGDEITVKWSTHNAQQVLLTIEGVTESLDEKEFSGERVAKVKKDSLVILEAINNSGDVMRSEYVHAIRPNPSIKYFTVTPTTVTKGESVTVAWAVEGEGIETVTISPFEDPLPPKGQLTFFPEASMEFVMTVKSRSEKQLDPLMRSVGVLPQPNAPVINFFKVVPTELSIAGDVEISWSVTGATTDIVLTSTDGTTIAGLPAQGFRTISITKTTSLMLTAYNGKLSAADAKEVELTPLIPVQVKIISVAPNQAVRVNDTIFVTVSVLPLKDGVATDPAKLGYPPVSGKVTVTTGYDSCEVDLEKAVGCKLGITKIVGHTLTANYTSDGTYASGTSAPWENLDVQGNPVSISATPGKDSLIVGESTSLTITVSPVTSTTPPDPAIPPVKGKVNVYNGGTNTTPICENIDLVTDTTDEFSGTATCSVSFTTPGSKTLTVQFYNSDIYQTKDQLLEDIITVAPAPVTLSLTDLSSGTTVVGESFQVQVVVSTNPPATGTPTGTITVKDNAANDSCTAALVSGLATCNLRLYNVGSSILPRTIEATYQPNTTSFLAGTPVTVHHVVNQARTTITAISMTPTSGSASAQYGTQARAAVTLNVLSPGSGTPTGIISVMLDGTSFCSINLSAGVNECSGLLNRSGAATITAVYNGNTNYQASPLFTLPSTYTINKAPTTLTISNLTHNSNPSGPGEVVTLYYTVALSNTGASIADQPAGTITLSGNPPGNESNASSPCTYPSTPTNSCSLTLTVEDQRTVTATFRSSNPNVSSSSASIDYFVKKSSDISLYGYQSGPIVGQEVTFYYSIVSSDGIGSPTTPSGSVSITAQSTTPEATINCVMVSNTNSCRITFLDAVNYTITASYSGDTQFASSTRTIPSYGVNQATTTISNVSYSANPVVPSTPFIASFQVINLDTNLMPSGTAWVLTSPTSLTSLCENPDRATVIPATSGVLRTDLNSTTGTGYALLTIPSQPYYIAIYYAGTTNFSDFCYSGQISH